MTSSPVPLRGAFSLLPDRRARHRPGVVMVPRLLAVGAFVWDDPCKGAAERRGLCNESVDNPDQDNKRYNE
jgi:hypothetical protein